MTLNHRVKVQGVVDIQKVIGLLNCGGQTSTACNLESKKYPSQFLPYIYVEFQWSKQSL